MSISAAALMMGIMVASMLAATAAGVTSDVVNAKQVEKTNQANIELANQTNAFNAQQAQLDRDFQAQQSATQYSRAVADLKSAGLNPALAMVQGGNTAASGSAATGVVPQMKAPSIKATAGALAQAASSASQFAWLAYGSGAHRRAGF